MTARGPTSEEQIACLQHLLATRNDVMARYNTWPSELEEPAAVALFEARCAAETAIRDLEPVDLPALLAKVTVMCDPQIADEVFTGQGWRDAIIRDVVSIGERAGKIGTPAPG